MKDRIKELMEAQHMNQQTFSNYTGINTATLSGILTGRTQPSTKVIDSIMKKFPNVNLYWLMMGEGGMLNTSSPTPSSSPSADAEQNLFSSSQQPEQSHSPQSEISNVTIQSATSTTPQSATRPAPTHSDNMAVTPNIFDSTTPQSNVPVQPIKAPVHSPTFRQQNPISHVVMEQPSSPTPSKRRVTEIRIFYDDQTWEAFVPKNK